VFDISYFRQNPHPFYVLAKELYPGKFFPTIAHSFIALLDKKWMLQMLFTQNIDCLERRAGVPGDKIVEAHGSFATQRCIDCKTEYPDDLMKKAVEHGEVPHCIVPQCNGLVKPDIVFFGERLPETFFRNEHVPATADLIIVMGTSLSVQPFASLPQFASEGVPRILINKELVGDFGCRSDDVVVLEDCDEGVRKLADALGWRDELESMWWEVAGKFNEKEAATFRDQRQAMSKDEILEAEIEKLTGEVDAALRISKDHEERVNTQLEKSSSREAFTSATLSTSEEVPPTPGTIEKQPKDDPSTAQSSSASEFPSMIEVGHKDPPSTSTVAQDTSQKTEKINKEIPATTPQVDSRNILDVTLPHQRPNAVTESDGDEKRPPSRI
jgi:NAD-dependent histone deacetylase SIR2